MQIDKSTTTKVRIFRNALLTFDSPLASSPSSSLLKLPSRLSVAVFVFWFLFFYLSVLFFVFLHFKKLTPQKN